MAAPPDLEPPNGLAAARLDSWKQIADYLKRDVTTVRRWEKREQLPVHRHLHDKLGSVYAYTHEIDEWFDRRRGRLDSTDPADPAGTRSAAGARPSRRLGMSPRERLGWTLAAAGIGLALVSSGLITVWMLRAPRPEPPAWRFVVRLPDDARVDTAAVSPDGRAIAFAGSINGGRNLLWIQPLDSTEPAAVPRTEGAAHPFWSPDGRQIGFFAGGTLKKISLSTHAVRDICNAPDALGGTWNSQDVILFASAHAQPIFRVSADGGAVRRATSLDRPNHRGHFWPEFLPDGRHFLYSDSGRHPRHGIYVGDLVTGTSQHVLAAFSSASFADGYLLFVDNGVLVAQAFDLTRLSLSGPRIALADGVAASAALNHKGFFSVSRSGVLVFRGGAAEPRHQLVWIDRSGRRIGALAEPGLYSDPSLSPDESMAAATRFEPHGSSDIWLFGATNGVPTRLTTDRGIEVCPLWSPDQAQILFATNRARKIEFYQKRTDGAGLEDPVLAAPGAATPESWSRDGRFVTYASVQPTTGLDIFAWPRFGNGRPFPIAQTKHDEAQSQISPDGRLVAYASDESGRLEVYVQTFPAVTGRWQISTAGGADPKWRRDGRELFYIAPDGMLTAVNVTNTLRFEHGAAQALFDTRIEDSSQANARNHYDVASGGQRFLLAMPEDDRQAVFTVLTNWKDARNRQ